MSSSPIDTAGYSQPNLFIKPVIYLEPESQQSRSVKEILFAIILVLVVVYFAIQMLFDGQTFLPDYGFTNREAQQGFWGGRLRL